MNDSQDDQQGQDQQESPVQESRSHQLEDRQELEQASVAPLDEEDVSPGVPPPDRLTAAADADWTRPLDVRRLLRNLLVGAAVLLCLSTGWYVMQRHRLARQNQLTDQIRQMGGTPHYDSAFDERGRFLPAERQSQGFLALALGEDLFRTVEGVSFEAGFDRRALTLLSSLQELHSVSLRDTAATDDDLATLAQTPQLRRLDLSGTLVTAHGLQRLGPLPRLRELTLDDEVLARIGKPEMARILPNCQVNEADLRLGNGSAKKEGPSR